MCRAPTPSPARSTTASGPTMTGISAGGSSTTTSGFINRSRKCSLSRTTAPLGTKLLSILDVFHEHGHEPRHFLRAKARRRIDDVNAAGGQRPVGQHMDETALR